MESQVIAVVKPGCPACEGSKPGIRQAKKIVKKVRFQELNYDKNPEIADNLNVDQFPELVYTNRNGVVHKMPWNGIPTARSIVDWIDSMHGKTVKTTAKNTQKRETCSQCGPNGVDKKVWGPPLWFVIHMTALSYPQRPSPEDTRRMVGFLRGLVDVLPCSYCQKHFAAELKRIDRSVFRSRDTLFEWSVRFHDSVSDRTHNPQPRRSVQYWRQHYKRQAWAAIQDRLKERLS